MDTYITEVGTPKLLHGIPLTKYDASSITYNEWKIVNPNKLVPKEMEKL